MSVPLGASAAKLLLLRKAGLALAHERVENGFCNLVQGEELPTVGKFLAVLLLCLVTGTRSVAAAGTAASTTVSLTVRCSEAKSECYRQCGGSVARYYCRVADLYVFCRCRP